MRHSQIFVKKNIKLPYLLSFLVGVFVAGSSLAGLVFQNSIYPTEELRNSFVANDVVNLLIGLPILFGSMQLARRGALTGLLLWPGALLYNVYNYIAYVFGAPPGVMVVGYAAIVLLSGYTIIYLLNSIEMQAIREQLEGAAPVKGAGWTMVLFGTAFLLRAISMIVPAVAGQKALSLPDTGVLIADIVLSVLWIAGGGLLLRRRSLGYASGLGLLFAASMLFAALVIFLLLQPLLTGSPFALVDALVVLVMGVICSIPFFLYLRSVAKIR